MIFLLSEQKLKTPHTGPPSASWKHCWKEFVVPLRCRTSQLGFGANHPWKEYRAAMFSTCFNCSVSFQHGHYSDPTSLSYGHQMFPVLGLWYAQKIAITTLCFGAIAAVLGEHTCLGHFFHGFSLVKTVYLTTSSSSRNDSGKLSVSHQPQKTCRDLVVLPLSTTSDVRNHDYSILPFFPLTLWKRLSPKQFLSSTEVPPLLLRCQIGNGNGDTPWPPILGHHTCLITC